jgi:hypothetical protein
LPPNARCKSCCYLPPPFARGPRRFPFGVAAWKSFLASRARCHCRCCPSPSLARGLRRLPLGASTSCGVLGSARSVSLPLPSPSLAWDPRWLQPRAVRLGGVLSSPRSLPLPLLPVAFLGLGPTAAPAWRPRLGRVPWLPALAAAAASACRRPWLRARGGSHLAPSHGRGSWLQVLAIAAAAAAVRRLLWLRASDGPRLASSPRVGVKSSLVYTPHLERK